jgi:hypothetical protein
MVQGPRRCISITPPCETSSSIPTAMDPNPKIPVSKFNMTVEQGEAEEQPAFSPHRPHSVLRISEQIYGQAFDKLNEISQSSKAREEQLESKNQKQRPKTSQQIYEHAVLDKLNETTPSRKLRKQQQESNNQNQGLIPSQQIYEHAVPLKMRTQKATLVQIPPRRLGVAELDGGWITWAAKGSIPLSTESKKPEPVYDEYVPAPSMEVKIKEKGAKDGKKWEKRDWMGADWEEIDLHASAVFSPSASEVGEFEALVRGEERVVDMLPEDRMIELEDLGDSSDDDAGAILKQLPSLPSLKEASVWSEGDWQAYLMCLSL